MSAYVDGELTGVEMLEIRRHLSQCPECAEEHAEVLFTKQTVARLGTVAPRKDFAAAIIAKLDEADVPRYERLLNSLRHFAHERLSPVAAAVVASGVALVIMSAVGIDSPPVRVTDTAMTAPYAAKTLGVGGYTGPVHIPSEEPLVVAASDVSGFGGDRIELAGFSHR